MSAALLRHVDEYLAVGQQAGASDIHLGVNAPPVWRLHGTLQPIWPDAPRFKSEQTKRLADSFLTDAQRQLVEERGDADFAYANAKGRYRASVVRQRLGTDIVFRIINARVRTMDELGLPEHLKLLTRYQNGLILVTGSVGSGKSTTLAALVEQVNLERREHIITLEDPIEYVFEPKGCHITQREVHTHTASFGVALRGALREDPDVIMVGEMRDLETVSLAITASETGHLVLGTLHTGTAARTLDRILDVFPVDQQAQIRIMISESLRGIISQQLIPRADGTGRVLAIETLTNTPAVSNIIREARTFMLPGIIQTGRKQGMQLMDDALIELHSRGLITAEEALAARRPKTDCATTRAIRRSHTSTCSLQRLMMKQIWKPGIHERKRNHDISWVPGFQIPLPAFLFPVRHSVIRKHQSGSDLQSAT
jgi:twitching motility protein PilT